MRCHAAQQVNQEPQSAGAILIVQPRFGSITQTAANNAFQHVAVRPRNRNGACIEGVRRSGQGAATRRCRVHGRPDTSVPVKPDAIFPSNWVSFHFDGTVALYPMLAPNLPLGAARGRPRAGGARGRIPRLAHLRSGHREAEASFSRVRVAWCWIGSTSGIRLPVRHRILMYSGILYVLDYDLVTFEAHGIARQPVYHTNVVMAIGTRFAVVCGEAIRQPLHRDAVFGSKRERDIVDISAPR